MLDFLSNSLIDRSWGGNAMMSYFIMFIVLIYIFSETEIDTKVLVAMAVAGLYMKYKLETQKEQSQSLIIDKSTVIDKKYKYINQNIILKKMIHSIKIIRKYNKRSFDLAVKHLDNFMYYINVISRKPFAIAQVYDIVKQERKETLNQFSSILLSIPTTPGHYGDNLVDQAPYEKILEIFIEDLRSITYTSLMRAGDLVNYQWDKKKNMYSGTADLDGETDTFIPEGIDPLNNIDSYHLH